MKKIERLQELRYLSKLGILKEKELFECSELEDEFSLIRLLLYRFRFPFSDN